MSSTIRRLLAVAAIAACAVLATAPVLGQGTVTLPGTFDGPPAKVTVQAAPAPAAGTIFSVGQAFGWLEPYVDSALAAIILGILGKLGLDKNAANGRVTDKDQRTALETFLLNQASSLVAGGFVRLNGLKVNVTSHQALAAAAANAVRFIPDAVAHFGLTPETLQAKIVDKLAQVPAVAAATAATVAPSADGQPAAASSVMSSAEQVLAQIVEIMAGRMPGAVGVDAGTVAAAGPGPAVGGPVG